MPILPVGFVVARHRAEKEIEQERFLGVSGAVEQIEFVVRMSDNDLLVVFRFLVLLEQLRDAEFL
ncbi:MAG: hypothetical protein ACRD4X_01105 [Candidatus Acidiferrales bacterium]